MVNLRLSAPGPDPSSWVICQLWAGLGEWWAPARVIALLPLHVPKGPSGRYRTALQGHRVEGEIVRGRDNPSEYVLKVLRMP